jgi:hypothetical protein
MAKTEPDKTGRANSLANLVPQTQNEFFTIRQGTATNELPKLKAKKENTKVDKVERTVTVTQGDFSITVPNNPSLEGIVDQNIAEIELPVFRLSTNLLFEAIKLVFTEEGGKSAEVLFPVERYMNLRGLKDKKEARKQIEEDLESLFNARISFREKLSNGNVKNYRDIRILGDKGIENNIIKVVFTQAYYSILSNYSVAYYSPYLFTYNWRNKPVSFYLSKKLSDHRKMNLGKRNENIISVKSLLESASIIPSYEVVRNTDKHVDQRIFSALADGLDKLHKDLSWYWCYRDGTPIPEEELTPIKYEIASKWLVHIEWKDDPYKEKRLELQKKRAKQARKNRKNTPKKGL